jgi:hypothetical protein
MYLERPASPALSPFVTCRWLHRSELASVERVVPDACMDMLWDGELLSIAGPDTAPVHVSIAASEQIVAVRFAPGTGGAILGLPASALCDSRVPLAELWGDAARRLEERLQEAGSVQALWTMLEDAVASRHVHASDLDPLMLALVQTLQPTAAPPALDTPALPSVSQLARAAGVSERQLLRRARSAFGYGPPGQPGPAGAGARLRRSGAPHARGVGAGRRPTLAAQARSPCLCPLGVRFRQDCPRRQGADSAA